MAKMIRVKAGNNGPVILPAPIQGATQIGDEAIEVESTRFIRKRIEVGDLVLVDDDEEELPPPVTPTPTLTAEHAIEAPPSEQVFTSTGAKKKGKE